jgi:hypothetical protein
LRTGARGFVHSLPVSFSDVDAYRWVHYVSSIEFLDGFVHINLSTSPRQEVISFREEVPLVDVIRKAVTKHLIDNAVLVRDTA